MVNRSSLFLVKTKGLKAKHETKRFFALFLSLFLVFSIVDSRGFVNLFSSVSALDAPLEIVSIQVSGDEVKQAGESVSITIELSEAIETPYIMNLFFEITHDGITRPLNLNFGVTSEGSQLVGYFNIPVYNSNGDWVLTRFSYNGYANDEYYFKEYYYSADQVGEQYFNFIAGQFSVDGGIQDVDLPVLDSLGPIQGSASLNSCVSIEVFASDATSNVEYVQLGVILQNGTKTHYGTEKLSDNHFRFNFCPSRYDQEGMVVIESIFLFDSAWNTVAYGRDLSGYQHMIDFDLSEYSFMVSGTLPFPTTPEIIDINLEKSTMSGTDSMAVAVSINDQGYEYMGLSLHFLDVEGNEFVRELTYQGNGLFQGFISSHQYQQSGMYQLSRVGINIEGYQFWINDATLHPDATETMDFSDVLFELLDTTLDNVAPVLISINSQNEAQLRSYVNVNIYAQDDVSGVAQIELVYKHSEGNYHHVYANLLEGNHYQAAFYIGDWFESKLLQLTVVVITDYAGNRSIYYNQDLVNESWDYSLGQFTDLSSANIQVSAFPSVPTIKSIVMSEPEVNAGDNVQVMIELEENSLNWEVFRMTYRDETGSDLVVDLSQVSDNVFEGVIGTSIYTRGGLYQLIRVDVRVDEFEYQIYEQSLFEETYMNNLTGGNYTVVNSTFDDTPPTLISISAIDTVHAGGYASIDFIVSDDLSGVANVCVSYKFKDNQFRGYCGSQLDDTTFRINLFVEEQFANSEMMLHVVRVYDFAGNSKSYFTYDSPEDSWDYEVGEKIDLSDGTIQILGELSYPIITRMSHLEPIVSPNQMMNFTIEFENYNEEEQIQVNFVNDSGYGFYAYGYRVEENKYQFSHYFDQWHYSGTYYIREIALNYLGRYFVYTNEVHDLTAGSFELIGGVVVPEAPVLSGYSVSQPSYTTDETIEIILTFAENFSGINSMYGHFSNEEGKRFGLYFERIASGVYRAKMKVQVFTTPGVYELYLLNLSYNSGFSVSLSKRPENCMDCSSDWYFDESVSFEVYGTVTDVNAPVLKSISVSTNQVTLDDTISFYLEVEDDISGIFSVEVSVSGPNTGFTIRAHHVEGNIYRADYNIRYVTTPGEYKVQTVYLNDNAENHRCYLDHANSSWCDSYDFSETTFNVFGDHGQLNLKNVFIETLKLQADEGTMISIEFEGPYFSYTHLGVEFTNENGDVLYSNLRRIANGFYSGDFYPSQYHDNGIYTLNRISVCSGEDCLELLNGNPEDGSLYADMSKYQIEIYGNIDDDDYPVLLSSSLSKNLVTISDKLSFNLEVFDETSVVTGGHMILVHLETRKEIYFNFDLSSWLSKGAFIYINKFMAPGEWAVLNISISDSKYNTTSYYNINEVYDTAFSENYLDLDHLNFTVYGTTLDNTPPQILNLQLDNNQLSLGGYGRFTMDFIETESGFQGMHLVYVNKSTREPFWFGASPLGGNRFELHIPSNIPVGEYELNEIEIIDRVVNVNNYCNSQSTVYVCQNQSLPLGHMDIEITQDSVGFNDYSGLISNITFDKTSYLAGEEVKMSITLHEELWFAPRIFVWFRTIGTYASSFVMELQMVGEGTYVGTTSLDLYQRWGETAIVESIHMYGNGNDVHIINKNLLDQYSGVQYIADFDQASFTVVQNFFDETPPLFHQLVLESKTYEQRNVVPMQVWASDEESSVNQVTVRFRVAGTNERYDFYSHPDAINPNLFNSFFLYLSGWYRQGLWEVDRITIRNKFGLNTVVYSEKFYPLMGNIQNFDEQSFIYEGGTEDYLPPELISVEKDKSIVTKNDVVRFTLQATDNMSGVKSAQIMYQDSFGRGFSIELRKQLDDSFVGEWTVGEFTKPGSYRISYVFISDYAGNYEFISNSGLYFNYQSPDLSFMDIEVVGTLEDSTRPLLVGYELSTRQALIGEVFELTLDALDEESGVDWVHVAWSGPNSWLGQTVNVEKGHTGPIQMSVPIHTNVKAGVYQIAQIFIMDRAGNFSEYYHSDREFPQYRLLNFSELSIEVFGETQEIIIESIEVSHNQLIPSDVLVISMDIRDNILKPEQAVIHYVSSLGQTMELTVLPSTGIDYVGYYEVGEFDATASWSVDKVVFVDRLGTEFVIYNATLHPSQDGRVDMSLADFSIENDFGDVQAPVLNEVEVSKEENGFIFRSFSAFGTKTITQQVSQSQEVIFGPNDRVVYRVDAIDDGSGVEKVEVTYDVNGKLITFSVPLIFDEGTGKYTGVASIADYYPSGVWLVHKFVLFDRAGNSKVSVRSEEQTTTNLVNFEHLQLKVANTFEDNEAPVLQSLGVNLSSVGVGDVIRLEAIATDANEITSFEVTLKAKTFGVERKIVMHRTDDGRYVGSMNITESTLVDAWVVKQVFLKDVANNQVVIRNSKTSSIVPTMNFDASEFVVRGLSGIKLTQVPLKLKYHLNDPLILDGLAVVAVYTDGTEVPLSLNELSILGYQNSVANVRQSVLVQYKDKSTTFTVNVYERKPVSLHLIEAASKVVYNLYESMDLEGLVVKVMYDDGVETLISSSELEIVNQPTQVAGEQEVILSYRGLQLTYSVLVLKLQQNRPTAPTVESTTSTSIHLVVEDEKEYSKDGIFWNRDGMFENLLPGTYYSFVSRWIETPTHEASVSSEAVVVRTQKGESEIPDAPALIKVTDKSIEVEKIVGLEYSMDGIYWQDSGLFINLEQDSEYWVIARVKETSTHYASYVSDQTVVRTLVTVLEKFRPLEVIENLENMKMSVKVKLIEKFEAKANRP